MTNLIGGKVFVTANGRRVAVKGNVDWNMGRDKREAIVGADGVHGVKAMPQVPFIEFATSDRSDLDLGWLQNLTDATVVLQRPNGKSVVFSNAFYAGEGTIKTEEGEVACRFEAMQATEYTT